MDSDLLTEWDVNGHLVAQSIASFIGEYYSDTDLENAWDTLDYAGDNHISQMIRVPTKFSLCDWSL